MGFYGALRGSCEAYLLVPQQICRLSQAIPEADFTVRSALKPFFLFLSCFWYL